MSQKKENIVDENTVNKVVDAVLMYLIKESELHLKFLNNQIKLYQAEMNYLENTRPFFFQKKKNQEYNLRLEECENKMFETYKKMSEETEFIYNTKQAINNN